MKKRTSVEDALEIVLKHLPRNTPSTISEIAKETNLSWNVVDRAATLAMKTQDFFYANKIEVLGGRGRKIVLVDLRVELKQLPSAIREWFIEEKFFKTRERTHYSTEEARQILGTSIENKNRTKLESAIGCVLEALELEDELSVLELSKRTAINRRTIKRVLDLFVRFQSYYADSYIKKIEGNLVLTKHPDLYSLDETRMRYLLKKLYLPHLQDDLPKDKERILFQSA